MTPEQSNPERIWLSPAEDGIDRCWHTEPAPGLGDGPEGWTEYVRADKLAELEALWQAAIVNHANALDRIAELEAELEQAQQGILLRYIDAPHTTTDRMDPWEKMARDLQARAEKLEAALASAPSLYSGAPLHQGEMYGRYLEWYDGPRADALKGAGDASPQTDREG